MKTIRDVKQDIRLMRLGFGMLALLLVGGWGASSYHDYRLETKDILDRLIVEIDHHLEASESHAANDLSHAASLLRAMSQSHAVRSLLAGDSGADVYAGLSMAFDPIASHVVEFRLLDASGFERARLGKGGDSRLNFSGSEALVSRATSVCYLAARKIPVGSVYLAPLSAPGQFDGSTADLILPLMRIAMPVDSEADGGRKGLMVLFLDARSLYWRHVASPLPERISLRYIDTGFVYRLHDGNVDVLADDSAVSGADGLLRQRDIRPADWLTLDGPQRSLVWHFSEGVSEAWMQQRLQVVESRAWAVWIIGSVLILLLVTGMTISRRAALLADDERQRLLGEVKGLSQRLITAHEDERSALARVLHDDVAQALAAVQMRLGGLAQDCEGDGCDAADRVRGEESYIGKVMDALRGQLRLLRPPELDALGLRGALFGLLDEMQRLHALQIDAQIDASLDGLDGAQSMGIYRLVQETLSNIQRHAEASRVMLTLTLNSARIHLLIEDDGCGFEVGNTASGFGIVGMREQVALLDGEMLLDSLPGGGTRLHVHMAARPGDYS